MTTSRDTSDASDPIDASTVARWRKTKQLFAEAIERDGTTRRAWLEDACGEDRELLDDVLALVTAHEDEEISSSLEEPPINFDNLSLGASTSGLHLGPWQVDDLIARGGMGSVYRGRRADGAYDRVVAIKVIEPSRGASQVRERLQVEGKLLARLEHPNIARLYDLGVSDRGAPYIVMELVSGAPLTAYAKSKELDIRQRLHLFLQVCGAVAHAHRSLVIHRDLKPSNILVDLTGSVKLLDFGVAGLLRGEDAAGDADKQLLSAGTPLRGLTPNYASPEQFGADPITTASDVYSLGVVLHELLIGERPCDVASADPQAALAAILNRDPGVLDRGLERAARSRAGGLSVEDLAAVVRKAIEPAADRRYATVDELSRDLRQLLQQLPVSAVPDSPRYRARLFVRRHRRALAGLAVLFVALLAGLAGTLSQATIAARERDSAERKFGYARAVAGDLVFDVHDALAEIPGATRVREMILRRSLEYLDRLSAEPESDHELKLDVARAYLRVGNVMGNPINANLGLVSDAMASYEKGLTTIERIEFPERDAASAVAVGRRTAADSMQNSAALVHAQLLEARAAVYGSLGRPDSAVADLSDAVSAHSFRIWSEEESAGNFYRLASAYVKLGDYTGNPNFPNIGNQKESRTHYHTALRFLERAVEAGDESDNILRERGVVLERLGVLYASEGDYEAAGSVYRESFRIRRALYERNPTRLNVYRDLGIAHEKLGLLFQESGSLDSALVRLNRSLDIYRSLAESDPENVQAMQTLAIGLLHVGDLMDSPNMPSFAQRDRAVVHYDEALRLLRRAAERDQNDTRSGQLATILEGRLNGR